MKALGITVLAIAIIVSAWAVMSEEGNEERTQWPHLIVYAYNESPYDLIRSWTINGTGASSDGVIRAGADRGHAIFCRISDVGPSPTLDLEFYHNETGELFAETTYQTHCEGEQVNLWIRGDGTIVLEVEPDPHSNDDPTQPPWERGEAMESGTQPNQDASGVVAPVPWKSKWTG